MRLGFVEGLQNKINEILSTIGFVIELIGESILIALIISFIFLPLMEKIFLEDPRSQFFILISLLLGGIIFFSLSPIVYFYMFLTASGLILFKRLIAPYF